MKTLLSITLAAGLATSSSGCNPPKTANSDAQREADLAAIEDLHQRDREASLAGDTEALLALWSDDPAALPPRGPILRGREALETMMGRMAEAKKVWQTIEYQQNFDEVEVFGDYALDWGTYRGRSRNVETGQEVGSSGKLMRILKRAPDGSWTVHRSIWNVDPTAGKTGDQSPD